MSCSAQLVDATVIVCTYNRAASLKDTLQALQQQAVSPDRDWEVLVVDNNSTDATAKVVAGYSRTWSRLRYAFEPQQGLSHARNQGIAAAKGEILLFTDDDVLPEPNWLDKTLAGFKRYDADACGGYIAPVWEAPPPRWLTERFYGFLAVRVDREDCYVMCPEEAPPFGANMAFRRAVFERVGPFDTNRGRKGNVLASGEDGEMFDRIHQAGLRVVFLGNARVHHRVEAFRCTKRYLRRWRRQTSRNLALTKGVPGARRLLNIPLYLLPQLGRAIIRMAVGRLTQPADEAFFREMIVSHFIGTIEGLYQTRTTETSRKERVT